MIWAKRSGLERAWHGMLDRILSRPNTVLRTFAFAVILTSIAAVALMLHVPIVSVDARVGPSGTITLSDGRQTLVLPGEEKVRFRAAVTDEEVVLPAALLPAGARPRGDRAANRSYWRDRDRLAAMLMADRVTISANGHHLTATARRRSLSDLTIGFWISLVAGAIAALAGLWVWVLRPRAWAPIMFALSGIGLFVGCATIAVNVSGSFALSGSLDQAVSITNHLGGLLCSTALVALFARFPLPLVRPLWIGLLAVASAAAAVNVTFDLLRGAVDLNLSSAGVYSVFIIILLALQVWLARRDDAGVAALLPIAIGTGVSVVLFGLLTLVGQLDGGAPLVSPDMSAPLLLMIYLGLGVAIIRARLFALGRWALGMLLSACAIILFLMIDAILLSTITQQREVAFLLSAALGATVYLPLREWMLRRAERLRDRQSRDLLQYAGDIAMAVTPQAASHAWHGAVIGIFEPLEVTTVPYTGPVPDIRASGSGLYLPSPVDGTALLLRYAGGGVRIFGPHDVDMAHRFSALITRLVEARDAYMRGVTEERGRIARDLHDDVSARLLTSLHRTTTDTIHQDIRTAMADIRTIITGLSGRPQSLHTLVASLRHETQTRLEAANIDLHWPLTSAGDHHATLDYASYRHLLSIVRECVSNIIRHSGASRAEVIIDVRGQQLAIEIKDNGRGFPIDHDNGNGLGNVERRVASIGGVFDIQSGSGGTTVRLALPLAKEGQITVPELTPTVPRSADVRGSQF